MKITFRQAREEDYEFLWNLHKATIRSYVDETWGWDKEFQEKYFSTRFDEKDIQLIKFDNTTIGAIEIQDRETELFIVNFEIAPPFQSKGIGSTILKRLINTSDNKRKSLILQVLKVNPAKRFYKRFGFKTETHYIMERSVA